jgi:hypothetical protein
MHFGQSCSKSRTQRRTRLVVGLSLLVLVVALAVVLSGCGGKLVTYTDNDFGFSFQYNDSWTLKNVDTADLPPDLSKSVRVFDPTGSSTGNDLTFDYISVDVYEVDPTLELTETEAKAQFTSYLDQIVADDSTATVIEDPSSVTVNGLPAIKATYSYAQKDLTVRTSEYWLAGDSGVLLMLYTSSSDKNWNGNSKVFTTFLNSFSIGSGASGTTTTAG